MGPEKFGIYNYALAIITIFVSVASLGMNGVVVRELIKDEKANSIILGSSCFLQVVGSVLASILVLITVFALKPGDWDLFWAALVMIPSVLLRTSDIYKYWFESQVLAKYTVLAQSIAFFGSAIFKILVIVNGGSYLYICASVSLEALILAIGLSYFFPRKVCVIPGN